MIQHMFSLKITNRILISVLKVCLSILLYVLLGEYFFVRNTWNVYVPFKADINDKLLYRQLICQKYTDFQFFQKKRYILYIIS